MFVVSASRRSVLGLVCVLVVTCVPSLYLQLWYTFVVSANSGLGSWVAWLDWFCWLAGCWTSRLTSWLVRWLVVLLLGSLLVCLIYHDLDFFNVLLVARVPWSYV